MNTTEIDKIKATLNQCRTMIEQTLGQLETAQGQLDNLSEKQARKYMDLVSTQAELISYFLAEVGKGKMQLDDDVESEFLKTSKKLIALKKEQIDADMDLLEAERLDQMRRKKRD